MQFKFPQFIEVEDKIFGPLTFKQFLYLGGAGGVVVVAFSFLPKFLAVFIALPVAALGLALAFFRVNNRPFMFAVESFVKYAMKEKLYIWKKEDKKGVAKEGTIAIGPVVPLPKLSESKLKNISWSLDVKKGGDTDTQQ